MKSVLMMSQITSILKRYFISGVLVVVPIILTYIVLKFLFETIDGILQPLLFRVLGYFVPGLGVLTTILLILLAGVLTRNYVGARLHSLGERLLIRLPFVRPIYSAAKQLLEATTGHGTESFKEVVLVEYPRKGVWALGFISNQIVVKVSGTTSSYTTVFVPSTPTPVSGMVIILPLEDIHRLDMTIEEGIKFLVSGGVASPQMIQEKDYSGHIEDKEEVRETRKSPDGSPR